LDTAPMVQRSRAGLTVHWYMVVVSSDVATIAMRAAEAAMVGVPSDVESKMLCVSEIDGIFAAVTCRAFAVEKCEAVPRRARI